MIQYFSSLAARIFALSIDDWTVDSLNDLQCLAVRGSREFVDLSKKVLQSRVRNLGRELLLELSACEV